MIDKILDKLDRGVPVNKGELQALGRQWLELQQGLALMRGLLGRTMSSVDVSFVTARSGARVDDSLDVRGATTLDGTDLPSAADTVTIDFPSGRYAISLERSGSVLGRQYKNSSGYWVFESLGNASTLDGFDFRDASNTLMRLISSGIVFNDDGSDIDFRVETSNYADAFKVNALTDQVTIYSHGASRIIDVTGDVIVESTTAANTTDETTIFTGSIAANDLGAGQVIKVQGFGLFSTTNASDTVTLRFKLGSTTLATLASSAGNVTDVPWDIQAILTVRTTGATGTVSSRTETDLNGTTQTDHSTSDTIDTTAAQNITITAQWDAADPDNSIQIDMGYMEIKGA